MAKFRLSTVLTIAQEREEQARQSLEKRMSEQQHAEAQLQQLRSYREDYEQRQRGGKALSPIEWQGYQDFLIRIQQALDIQTHVCKEAEKNVELAREDYFKQRRFLKGIEHLEEKHLQAEAKRLERAEQKLLDELSIRQYKKEGAS